MPKPAAAGAKDRSSNEEPAIIAVRAALDFLGMTEAPLGCVNFPSLVACGGQRFKAAHSLCRERHNGVRNAVFGHVPAGRLYRPISDISPDSPPAPKRRPYKL
jgi:hypothetical protein